VSQAVLKSAGTLPTGPFDSLRDFALALEAHGRLVRIPEMDQDKFESTGFCYRLIEEFGYDDAPAFLVERIKVDGRWLDGPVLGNIYGGWLGEALALGVQDPGNRSREVYRRTFAHLDALLDDAGRWPTIEPIENRADKAPCKQNILTGKDVDILQFPWIQTNPADAGRYITAASVFIEDPEMGRNVGTYRCQVKDAKRIGVNAEIGQHAWSFLMRVKKREQKSVPAAVVMGADPLIFALSTSKIASLGEDELQIAGGLRGRPVELVKCETSDIHVPAHAEIVLEGEIRVDKMEEEGPYGETYGYMGLKKDSNFFMDVKAVTYRDNPWVSNSYAGITKLTMGIPQLVTNNRNYRRVIPNLVEFFRPTETNGVVLASIRKRLPGDGMLAGQHIAAGDIFGKVIVVVDDDVDVHDRSQVMRALGTRWQPHPASAVLPQTKGMPLDPSAPTRWLTSKIIIDATRQLPGEGGPDKWPEVSRVLLEKLSPETFDIVSQRWPEYLRHWRR
jgi:4-hydroxy-3-polyprenylbenzoate decarboxylase